MTTIVTLGAGQQQTISMKEGDALNIIGAASSLGVVYRLNDALGGGNSLQSWQVGAGSLPTIGPYPGTNRFLLTCAVGSMAAAVSAAVLSLSGGGVVATITPAIPVAGVPSVATLPAGSSGTLQFTLTSALGVKTNVGNPSAAGSKTLSYTPSSSDVGMLGIDVTNIIASTAGGTIAAAPVVKPDAPTSVVATAGNGAVSVTGTPPANNGGAAITSWRATLSNGNMATSTTLPVSVPSTNGVAVTATLAALNSAGWSPESSPVSNSVTPVASGVTNNVFAGSRNQVPTNTVNIPIGFACQRPHVNTTGGTLTNIIFTDLWWCLNPTFGITVMASTVGFKKFLEYPRGTFTLVAYNSGAVNYTMSPTNIQQDSDAVTTVSVPNGATYWEHTLMVSNAASDVACIELPAGSSVIGTLDAKYAFTSNTPASQTAGTTSINYFGSSVIRGTVSVANVKSLFISGDSISFGQGDITSVGAAGSSGYLARWADRVNLGYAKFTKPGMSASDVVAALAASPAVLNPYFALITTCCTHHLSAWGTNDFRLGRTQTQVTGDIGTIQAQTPGKKLGQMTLLDRTTSTDGWTTASGQTIQTDGNWGAVPAFNDATRALLPGCTFFGESSDLVSTARNSGIWAAPPAQTPDGTHLVSVAAAAAAAGLNMTLP